LPRFAIDGALTRQFPGIAPLAPHGFAIRHPVSNALSPLSRWLLAAGYSLLAAEHSRFAILWLLLLLLLDDSAGRWTLSDLCTATASTQWRAAAIARM
jgi:hypothetical protein